MAFWPPGAQHQERILISWTLRELHERGGRIFVEDMSNFPQLPALPMHSYINAYQGTLTRENLMLAKLRIAWKEVLAICHRFLSLLALLAQSPWRQLWMRLIRLKRVFFSFIMYRLWRRWQNWTKLRVISVQFQLPNWLNFKAMFCSLYLISAAVACHHASRRKSHNLILTRQALALSSKLKHFLGSWHQVNQLKVCVCSTILFTNTKSI